MPHLHIGYLGKPIRGWIGEGISEYSLRLASFFKIEWHLFKTDLSLKVFLDSRKEAVLLDPQGATYTSEGFSSFFYDIFERGGASVTFVVGGANGFSKELKQGRKLLSLSSLTFTHQVTPLILLEQVYRAVEIRRGSPYHK